MAFLCLALACLSTALAAPTWQPSAGHTELPIWPGLPPGAVPDGTETLATETKELVAGKPWHYIEHVSRPTLTVYSPEASNNGAAVVVFPGGGFEVLAIDLEGTEACDQITARSMTCVLVKYRVPAPRGSAPYWRAYPASSMALQDAERALRLVRYHAADWHIDPHKIGVMGFSAGGHLVAALSVHFSERLYPPVDAADDTNGHPDFAVAIYPGHLALFKNKLDLNPDIARHITPRTPPTFLLQAEDDDVDGVEQSLVHYIALKKAGVPVEMHLYARGGHAFGSRRTRFPITAWPELVDTWLRTLGMLPRRSL